MKLAVFGASGATGRQLVQQALEAGHSIAVLVRTAASLPVEHARLRRVVGALDDADAVRSVVDGADAVISVLGVRNVRNVRKGSAPTVCSDGIRSILPAMDRTGVRRLVALSAYGASETRHASWFIRLVRCVIGAKMRDKDAMEQLVRASATDWTLVRPPALHHGKSSGKTGSRISKIAGANYRAGAPLRPGVTARLARADLGAFILQTVEQGNYIGAAPIVFR
jgi:uncharacterized protein YbjT (DUF2867 family)